VEYDSLVHLWSQWYRECYDSDQPRIFVRFEDVLFAGPAVVRAITECVGLVQQPKPFHYVLQASKSHGTATNDFVGALIKYGSAANRTKLMTADDKEYIRKYMDTELMRVFRYHVDP
jgi:hypothetical protein